MEEINFIQIPRKYYKNIWHLPENTAQHNRGVRRYDKSHSFGSHWHQGFFKKANIPLLASLRLPRFLKGHVLLIIAEWSVSKKWRVHQPKLRLKITLLSPWWWVWFPQVLTLFFSAKTFWNSLTSILYKTVRFVLFAKNSDEAIVTFCHTSKQKKIVSRVTDWTHVLKKLSYYWV